MRPIQCSALHRGQATSGGARRYVPALTRAAVAVGSMRYLLKRTPIQKALSDGPNMIPLDELLPYLHQVRAIRDVI